MARSNGAKTKPQPEANPQPETPVAETDLEQSEKVAASAKPGSEPEAQAGAETLEIEDCLNALKALLSAVEKLQKARQDVGDIKPLLVRMLDGEVMAGEELEQLKTGVNGLSRLVRAYSDHQTALTNAQPARQLLDDVLKVKNPQDG